MKASEREWCNEFHGPTGTATNICEVPTEAGAACIKVVDRDGFIEVLYRHPNKNAWTFHCKLSTAGPDHQKQIERVVDDLEHLLQLEHGDASSTDPT